MFSTFWWISNSLIMTNGSTFRSISVLTITDAVLGLWNRWDIPRVDYQNMKTHLKRNLDPLTSSELYFKSWRKEILLHKPSIAPTISSTGSHMKVKTVNSMTMLILNEILGCLDGYLESSRWIDRAGKVNGCDITLLWHTWWKIHVCCVNGNMFTPLCIRFLVSAEYLQ